MSCSCLWWRYLRGGEGGYVCPGGRKGVSGKSVGGG